MAETTHKHPNYLAVWGGLAFLTVVEVGVVFLSWAKLAIVLTLVFLALWKALMVALYFMHLKYEGTRLRILAIAPLPLAVIMVLAVITEFRW